MKRSFESKPTETTESGDSAPEHAVKAAATDSIFALTGIEGQYDPRCRAYLTPELYRT